MAGRVRLLPKERYAGQLGDTDVHIIEDGIQGESEPDAMAP